MKKRTKRAWHKDFLEYMKFIVNHPNYADMPNKFKPSKKINWVSPSDALRAQWWDQKVKELKCKSRAEVARMIHPKELLGLKPCQVCGRKMYIAYVYSNKNTLKKLNKVSGQIKFSLYQETISEIFDKLRAILKEQVYNCFSRVFNLPDYIDKERNSYLEYIYKNCLTRLSPGVMSNPPDRLDGFHTYNACCRSKQDKGRSRRNLARYTQDRRAYENWAEGNWNLANRLMGEFGRYSKLATCPKCGKLRKLTADHLGPLSLGFRHTSNLRALCKGCNSQRNNRMTLKDIQALIMEEKRGEKVISWHSKYIWDLLKNKVHNEKEALRLSKIMRVNLHHILIIFSVISEKGFDNFLVNFLHPEYSYMDYKFLNFNPLKGSRRIIEKPLSSKNKLKNAKRYLRISFEALQEYKQVKNRNTKIWKSGVINALVDRVISFLAAGSYIEAEKHLRSTLKRLALEAAKNL